jgi:hypothetical protein
MNLTEFVSRLNSLKEDYESIQCETKKIQIEKEKLVYLLAEAKNNLKLNTSAYHQAME